MSLYVSPGQSLPLPLSLSFSGISFNPVYYASLLLRTFAFEIAAGGLRHRVAPGAAQAPWGPNRRVQGPPPPPPICADPRQTLPTSPSVPAAPRPWGPDEQKLYYLEGEPGQGSCTPIYLLWPSSGPIFPCQLSFVRASHMSVSNFQRARADAWCSAGMTLPRPHPQACLPVPAPLFP